MLAFVTAVNLVTAISEDILVGNVVSGIVMVFLGPVMYFLLCVRMGGAAILVPRARSLVACLPAVPPRLPVAIHSRLLDPQQP